MKDCLKAIMAVGIIILMITVTLGIGEDDADINLAGKWALQATGVVQGATEYTPCCPSNGAQAGRCGEDLNALFQMGDADINVTQFGGTLFASEDDVNGNPFILEGTIEGRSVIFTITGEGINPCLPGSHETAYTGTVVETNFGKLIEGAFEGFGSWTEYATNRVERYTWSGDFRVGIVNDFYGCDDGNACNGLETWNPHIGKCVAGIPVECEDAPCIKCDPATGECSAPVEGHPHMMCNGECVNTQNDDFNCGGCGDVITGAFICDIDAGEKCASGICKQPKEGVPKQQLAKTA